MIVVQMSLSQFIFMAFVLLLCVFVCHEEQNSLVIWQSTYELYFWFWFLFWFCTKCYHIVQFISIFAEKFSTKTIVLEIYLIFFCFVYKENMKFIRIVTKINSWYAWLMGGGERVSHVLILLWLIESFLNRWCSSK